MMTLRDNNKVSLWGLAVALFAFLVPLEGYLSTSAGSILKFYTMGCILFAVYRVFATRKNNKLHLCVPLLIVFLAFTGLSVLWSEYMTRGVDVYFAILLQVVFIIVCSVMIYSKRDVEIIMFAYICGSIILAMILLLTVSPEEVEQGRHSVTSSSGKAFDPNNIGALLVGGFALTINFPVRKKLFLVIKAIAIAIFVYSVFYTASRGAFLATILVTVYTIIQQKGKKKIGFLILALLIGLLLVVGSTYIPNNPLEYVFYRFETDDTGSNRTYLWEIALQCIAEKPFFGFGLGESAHVISKRSTESLGSHNTYITIAFEAGLFALLSLIIAIGLLWSKKRRGFYLDNGAFAMLLSGLFTSFFFDTYNKKIMWFPMLLCVISTTVRGHSKSREHNYSRSESE